jgi:hypothetical protein
MSSATTKKRRTGPQVVADGFAALIEKLGVADAIRFIHHYDSGHGDYTRDRHKWLDHLTLKDVSMLMAEARKSPAKKKRA